MTREILVDSGAIAATVSSAPWLVNCRLLSNTSEGTGGALDLGRSDQPTRIDQCLIAGNQSGHIGGAINCATAVESAEDILDDNADRGPKLLGP